MPPQIQILDSVIKRLDFTDSQCSGNLYGIMYDGKTLIVGFGFEPPEENESNSTISFFDQQHVLYPTGIDFCGMIDVGGPWPIDNFGGVLPKVKSKLKDVPVTNNPIYLSKNLETSQIDVLYLHGEHLITTNFSILTYQDFQSKFIYFRLLGNVPIDLPVLESLDHLKEMEDLSARIGAGMVFRIGKSDIHLYKYNIFQNLSSSIGKVVDRVNKSRDLYHGLKVTNVFAYFPASLALKEGPSITAPIMVDYSRSLPSSSKKDSKNYMMFDKHENIFKIHMHLPFDGLCIVYRERSIDDVYSLLIDAAERIVFFCELHLAKYSCDPFELPFLKTHHFYNEILGHPFSLIFRNRETDEDLVDLRVAVHLNFNIPMDRPYFRKGNALKFVSFKSKPDVLINPHEGLSDVPVTNVFGRKALVYGKYAYYHYMTGGVDDRGWGCAYRSFQTIYSWFKLQGYTTDDIPTYEEIQDVLVSIGDKPAVFKGSHSWIGSVEVSFVLQNKLDIVTRILNIQSGSEMDTLAHTLLEHFDINGTPVMVGGGSLAYTIIGVYSDEDDGQVKFLVLDPHYTGEDDLAAIQKKEFIGWKSKEFWSSEHFYNLCLPARPICF